MSGPERSTPVGVALVGCGAMGELVARHVYAGAGTGCRVVAVVDGRAQRRDALADMLGAAAFPSLSQAMTGAPVEAVDIRVPHAAHAEVAREAISHGMHLLVEKPLCTAIADADELVTAAKERGVVAAVAENYPHLLAVRAAAAAIEAGEIGAVRALRTTRAFTLDGVWVRDGWRRGAGILLDQGTHHTSLLRRLGGEIDTVSAFPGRARDASGEASESVLLTSRFSSGLTAQSLYTWDAAALEDEAEGTVYGSAGRIEIRVSYEQRLGGAVRLGLTSREADALSPAENYYDSHRSIIEDWVSCIREGRRPVVTLADGRADLAVVLAAARSLELAGAPVRVAGGSGETERPR